MRLRDDRLQGLALPLEPLRRQRSSVTTGPQRNVFWHFEPDDLRAETVGLGASGLTDVEGFHDSPQPPRGGDGLEADHTGADAEARLRPRGADSRTDHGNELGKVICRHDDGLVSGDRGHRGQSIHRLSSRYARDRVHRERCDVTVAEHTDDLVIGGVRRMEEGDEHLALADQLRLVLAESAVVLRLLDLEDDVRSREEISDIGDDLCAGGCIVIVRLEHSASCRGLDQHGETHLDVLGDLRWQRRYTPFMFEDLLGDSDDHWSSSSTSVRLTRCSYDLTVQHQDGLTIARIVTFLLG